jgi:hypothetical protein
MLIWGAVLLGNSGYCGITPPRLKLGDRHAACVSGVSIPFCTVLDFREKQQIRIYLISIHLRRLTGWFASSISE